MASSNTSPRGHRLELSRRAPLLALAALLVVTGCGAEDEGGAMPATTPGPATTTDTGAGSAPVTTLDAPAATTTTPAAPATTAAQTVDVPEILDFTARLVGGGSFSGAQLAGVDAVFWFWAPWCPTCAAAAGEVRETAAAHPDVTFVGVGGLSSDGDSMEEFVADHGVGGFDQIADTDGVVYTRFGVVQQHTFAFVSASGDVETVPAYGLDLDLTALIDDMFG